MVTRPISRHLRAALIGAGAGLGISALGLETSVSLSTYGLYLGSYGPYMVIAGVPVFLNVVFAYVLVRGSDRRVMRYSMLAAGVGSALFLGFLFFQGIFQGLLGSG